MSSSEMRLEEFPEGSTDYLICQDLSGGNMISCVIVEDEPGPYLEFVQELVNEGVCGLAMTAPFSTRTLNLLRGGSATFGARTSGVEVDVAIPNLAQCVVILDVRNDSEQSFDGYDPSDFERAGLQFYLQLRGFPGKLFYATRYGRGQLEESGASGAFGVVSLAIKSGMSGTMPKADKEKVRAALLLATVQCDTSSICSIFQRGEFFDITFRGEVAVLGAYQAVKAFVELIKADHLGLSDEELMERIGVRHREPKRKGEEDALPEVGSNEVNSIGLLEKLLEALRTGGVANIDYETFMVRLDADDEPTEQWAAEAIREIAQILESTDEDFAPEDLIEFLGPSKEGEVVVSEYETLIGSGSVSSAPDAPGLISRGDKLRCINQYFLLMKSAIPQKKAELNALLKQQRLEAAQFVMANPDADEVQCNTEQHRVLSAQIDETRKQLRDLGILRDDYFRHGIKSTPVPDGPRVIGYRPAKKASKASSYATKLKKRLLARLEEVDGPPPQKLAQHVDGHWVRSDGRNYYTGKDHWML